MIITLDRRKKNRNPVRTAAAEQRYGMQLKKVAAQVQAIISPFEPGDIRSVPTIQQLLDAYAEMLKPWATMTASNMLMDVALRDESAWRTMAKEMSRSLRLEIAEAPTGRVLQDLLAEQVDLITSIPREAGERVHELTLRGLEDSTRASEIAKEIMRSGEVAKSRALLIAQTEVSRTATSLTQARAEYVGSPGYIWRTSGDSDVREDHRELEGQFIPWNQPPIADKRTGRRAHAGCIYRCRCFPEVVIPD
ncbi:phage minor head protein [Herbaspirillum huttiense]|uniref:phage head morphogenesis protein n=1 Tax=Herbaspirillum huttiense TaxID=863372 RepID=UPI0031E30D64